MKSNSIDAYTWNIEINIESSTLITKLDSPTHRIVILKKNKQNTKLLVNIDNLERD